MTRREQTKKKIIDAFWEIYERERIEKITVKDICIGAGINRSTFYDYFIDVYDVLEQIEDSLLPSLDELPPVIIGGKPFGMEEIAHMEYFKKKKSYLRVLLSDKGDPNFLSKLKGVIKPSIEAVMGDNKPDNFDYILEYFISGMIGVMSYHIQNDKPILNIINQQSNLICWNNK